MDTQFTSVVGQGVGVGGSTLPLTLPSQEGGSGNSKAGEKGVNKPSEGNWGGNGRRTFSRQCSQKSNKSISSVDDGETPYCVVCCEELDVVAMGPCGHVLTCVTCAVRLREFYGNSQCSLCKQDSPQLVVTKLRKTIPSFDQMKESGRLLRVSHLPYLLVDANRGSRRSQAIIKQKVTNCAQLSCPKCKSVQMLNNHYCMVHEYITDRALSEHLAREHKKHFCMICQKSLCQFSSELELFDSKEALQEHMKQHPCCQFCNRGTLRFYSKRELQQHLQNEHYRCRICERMGRGDVWFEGVGDLLNHIRSDHITCVRCGGLVGFASNEELQQHMRTFHNDELTARGYGEVIVGVDPLRNELRIQLSVPQRVVEQGSSTPIRENIAQNRDRLRSNLVQLLSYFREILGNSEAAVYTIEEIIQHFDTRMDMLTTSNAVQSPSNENSNGPGGLMMDNTVENVGIDRQQDTSSEDLRVPLQNSPSIEVNSGNQLGFVEDYNVERISNDIVQDIGMQEESTESNSIANDVEEVERSRQQVEMRRETNDISQVNAVFESHHHTSTQIFSEEVEETGHAQAPEQQIHQMNLFPYRSADRVTAMDNTTSNFNAQYLNSSGERSEGNFEELMQQSNNLITRLTSQDRNLHLFDVNQTAEEIFLQELVNGGDAQSGNTLHLTPSRQNVGSSDIHRFGLNQANEEEIFVEELVGSANTEFVPSSRNRQNTFPNLYQSNLGQINTQFYNHSVQSYFAQFRQLQSMRRQGQNLQINDVNRDPTSRTNANQSLLALRNFQQQQLEGPLSSLRRSRSF